MILRMTFLERNQENIEWLTETASRAAYDPHPFSSDLVDKATERVESINRSRKREVKQNPD